MTRVESLRDVRQMEDHNQSLSQPKSVTDFRHAPKLLLKQFHHLVHHQVHQFHHQVHHQVSSWTQCHHEVHHLRQQQSDTIQSCIAAVSQQPNPGCGSSEPCQQARRKTQWWLRKKSFCLHYPRNPPRKQIMNELDEWARRGRTRLHRKPGPTYLFVHVPPSGRLLLFSSHSSFVTYHIYVVIGKELHE